MKPHHSSVLESTSSAPTGQTRRAGEWFRRRAFDGAVRSAGRKTLPQMNTEEHGHRDPLSRQVIGAFYEVYRELGIGFLEAVYCRALAITLNDRKR
jgi:PD-(D/E)XK nuclease superfamily